MIIGKACRSASRDASKLRKQPAIACYCKGEGGIQERRQNKQINTGYTCRHSRSCGGSLLLCVHNHVCSAAASKSCFYV